MSDKQFKHGPVTMFQMQKQKEIKELQKHIKELQKHVDSRKKELEKRKHAGESKFPLVFACFVLGFLIMLFLDQVAFKNQEHGTQTEHKELEMTDR